MGSIELIKLLINSVFSQRNARLATMDLKNFYLNTPLYWLKYVCIKLADIPQEFIDKYKLNKLARDSWIFLEMCCGMCGLPQAGILPTTSSVTALPNLLTTRQPPPLVSGATSGAPSCLHSLSTTLPFNKFQYIGNARLDHLCQALKKHYKVSEEMDGIRFASMTLKWNYSPNHAKRSCRLSMLGYIYIVCTGYKHPMPTKCQLSPHKHRNIIFGQTTQLTHVDPYSPPLSTEGIKRIQGIIGTLLYSAHAVDNKLLATLSTLGSQQATATEATNIAMNQLLEYLAT
jgi:hypothetical protein